MIYPLWRLSAARDKLANIKPADMESRPVRAGMAGMFKQTKKSRQIPAVSGGFSAMALSVGQAAMASALQTVTETSLRGFRLRTVRCGKQVKVYGEAQGNRGGICVQPPISVQRFHICVVA